MKNLVDVLEKQEVQEALLKWADSNTPKVSTLLDSLMGNLPAYQKDSFKRYLSIAKKIKVKFNSQFIATDQLALEQSSNSTISAYKASQYPDGLMLDLCCGIGGDSLFCTNPVIGIDLNMDRLIAAKFNHKLLRPDQFTQFSCEDVVFINHEANFFILDPDRRHQDQSKNWGSTQLKPSITEIHHLVKKYRSAWIKLSPAMDTNLFKFPFSTEFIGFSKSVNELSVKTGHFYEGEGFVKTTQLDPFYQETHYDHETKLIGRKINFTTSAKAYVYEPTPLALASRLHVKLAVKHELNILHPSIPYYSSDEIINHPFLNGYKTMTELNFREKKIIAFINKYAWSDIHVKKRGVDCDPNKLQLTWKKKVSLKKGAPILTFFLYPDSKINEKIKVLACQKL